MGLQSRARHADAGRHYSRGRTRARSPEGAGTQVLRRVHFRAHAGERVAVVGASGSGKSSLLKLIPRLNEPGEGTVLIDDRDVRSLTLQYKHTFPPYGE